MQIKKNQFKELKNINLAIGNFDGIHKGHRYLLEELLKLKSSYKNKLAVLSFIPHPVKILAPDKWKKNLIKFRTNYFHLKNIGIDYLLLIKFDKNFSNMSAKTFIEEILVKNLAVKNIVVGEDFKFGKNRVGDIRLLKDYANKDKFNLLSIKKAGEYNTIYSSSLVRSLIKRGKIEKANKILGYKWEVTGKVIKGKALGRKLGYPTANLKYLNQISPSKGIYACWVKIFGQNDWRMGAVSTGTRPHYQGVEEILEVYILNFSGNLYQKRIRVAFVSKIRNEEVFNSEQELIIKMKEDCKNIENILKKSLIFYNNLGIK